jgi:hypothetical protein
MRKNIQLALVRELRRKRDDLMLRFTRLGYEVRKGRADAGSDTFFLRPPGEGDSNEHVLGLTLGVGTEMQVRNEAELYSGQDKPLIQFSYWFDVDNHILGSSERLGYYLDDDKLRENIDRLLYAKPQPEAST